jgi:hypothetical protein
MALLSQTSRMQQGRFAQRVRDLREVADFLFTEVIASPSLIINSTTTILVSVAALSFLATFRRAFRKDKLNSLRYTEI